MQVLLRLYYPYDADLIALRMQLGRKFNHIIKGSLLACTSGVSYSIHISDNIKKYVLESEVPILVNISFNEKKEPAIVNMLTKVGENNSRNRGNFIKSVLRYSFDRFPLEVFGDIEVVKPTERIMKYKINENEVFPPLQKKEKKIKQHIEIKPEKETDKTAKKEAVKEDKLDKRELPNEQFVQSEDKEDAIKDSNKKIEANNDTQEPDIFNILENLANV